MKVTSYHFGSITIADNTYTTDVIITPEKVEDKWWRKQGHNLEPEDLTTVIAAQPEILVIGTGYYGRMVVPEKTLQLLHDQGIKTVVGRTSEAVEELNRLQRENARVVAALHLTC